MIETEDRLRDAFAAVDRQVAPPEWRRPTPRRHIGRVVAAAVVVLALAAGGAFAVRTSDDDAGVGVAAGRLSPAAFDERAGQVCEQLNAERRGRDPRFATGEAYRVVAEERLALIAVAKVGLEAAGEPSDDVGLPSRAVALLERAESRAGAVVTLAEAGNVEDAQQQWARVERLIDQALGALHRHGATECAP